MNNPTVYPDPSIVLAIYMRRAADRQRPAQIICHTETAVVNVDDVAAVEQEDDIDADAERASTTSREPLGSRSPDGSCLWTPSSGCAGGPDEP